LETALNDAENLILSLSNGVKPVLALHRQRVRANSVPDTYALLAWEYRILSLAAKANLEGSYKDGMITAQWVSELTKKSEHPDGPILAQKQLAEAGIALIVDAGMHLDGAALISDRGPVIGLTLRYDRLDNFWFVLFHELFHVIKHLGKYKLEGIFDDLDSDSTDKLEHEADSLAREALIANEIWDRSLVRYVRSPELVKEMANELQISPAIVAGCVRFEANNYIILNELIGQGEVRKQFPEAGFGS
jgi:HTH-type transcriptional regulator/antitoxin HigA